MIIAIDGPAGSGKSTTARAIAERLGYAYVDTGAMYRAVALAASERGLTPPGDNAAIIELAQSLPIALRNNGKSVYIGDRDVSDLIRTPEIGELTSSISTIKEVRAVIVEQQRRIAASSEQECGGAVLEGRDIQTVVCPDAPVKIFLTADLDTRAYRRLHQWQEKGEAATSQIAQQDVASRDARDSSRQVSPLRAAPDAIHIDTSQQPSEQVVNSIIDVVRAKLEMQK